MVLKVTSHFSLFCPIPSAIDLSGELIQSIGNQTYTAQGKWY